MRLIDADALVNDLEHDVELDSRALDDTTIVGNERENIQFDKDCKQNCIWLLTDAPTVEERKTGKWIEEQTGLTVAGHCSACGWECYLYEDDVVGMPYCPNCGAKMEGVES